MTAISTFKGINNVSDPLRLGLQWLETADNVDVTDTGAIKKRTGYSLALETDDITGAFSTFDFQRMYLVDDGALKAMTTASTTVTLQTGLGTVPMHFTEINDQVFYNNGADDGVIQQDNNVLPWRWVAPAVPVLAAVTGSLPAGTYRVCCTTTLADGRETGSSDFAELTMAEGQALQISSITPGANVYIAPADSTVYQYAGTPASTAMVWNASPDDLGRDLTTFMLEPLPLGCDVVQEWGGRIYAAQYLTSTNQTVIWFSQPLGFHLFDMAKDFFMVPGRVSMLAHHPTALLVGTEQRISAYTSDGITQLAPYGVVPGWHWSKDDGRTLFWSKRGLCSAMPFANLTENQISFAPGVSAGGAVVQAGGQKRYLVALQQGDDAFNPY